jgi:hypothetical protein
LPNKLECQNSIPNVKKKEEKKNVGRTGRRRKNKPWDFDI